MLSYIDGIERKKERFIILPMDFYFDTISLFKITRTNSKGKFIFHLFLFWNARSIQRQFFKLAYLNYSSNG